MHAIPVRPRQVEGTDLRRKKGAPQRRAAVYTVALTSVSILRAKAARS